MERVLPKPHANMAEYQKIMEAGFTKFSQREEHDPFMEQRRRSLRIFAKAVVSSGLLGIADY